MYDENHNLDIRLAVPELSELFGLSFQLWQREGQWRPFDAQVECDSAFECVLNDKFDSNQGCVELLDGRQALVVVPLESREGVFAALATVDGSELAHWKRLVDAAMRLQFQEHEIHEKATLLEELARLMEESTWLRGLSKCIEVCDVSQSVDTVAEYVLPQLQSLLQARCVGYLPAGPNHSSAVWTGDEPSEELQNLLDPCREAASKSATIVNARSLEQEQQLGFRCMAMAPVRFHDRLYGHLVAVDRVIEGYYWQIIGEPMSEHEFGTVESSLIDATAAMLATHHRNYELFHAREKLVTGVIRTLGGAVDARDPYTKGHSDRVALYAREIAREMQLDEAQCQRIYLTGLLHDVGKIGIPDSILKKPGKLTDFEYEVIKSHSQLGYDILEGLEDIEFVLPGVLHHHERIDGRGYPYGLVGDSIPLEARILAVADAYDAMTSSRSYRECMPFEKAERIVQQNIGSQFDETAAQAFLRILPKIHTIASSEKYGQKVDSLDVDDTLIANELIATLQEIDSAVAVARDE